ncbi:hypothetical protein GWI33_002084 [Rhynchophorus ferrugineus]|uniref:Uncharacterized protein n=1 Tax=Rhynchophorus ferrugineus TaxID=354439 RepID=A0A834IVL1_RHYFE|nr:hypothetical protein GWI33_002084 [Rhynchophorus ferrugineus]
MVILIAVASATFDKLFKPKKLKKAISPIIDVALKGITFINPFDDDGDDDDYEEVIQRKKHKKGKGHKQPVAYIYRPHPYYHETPSHYSHEEHLPHIPHHAYGLFSPACVGESTGFGGYHYGNGYDTFSHPFYHGGDIDHFNPYYGTH